MGLSGQALLDTRAAFDKVAPAYGGANEQNPVLAAMRQRVMASIEAHVPPGAHVLDLGCGPGTDDEALARRGHEVTAIDWSPAMVDCARARVAQAGLAHRVHVHHLGIHEVGRLAPVVFDAACSNFGALNCVPDLDALAAQLSARLRHGAPLVASVIGRVCPWEIALYLARRDFTRARVRFSDGFVPVPLEGGCVWTRYYSPRAFVRPFTRAGFTQVDLRGLGLFVPPPYLEGFAARHPRVMLGLHALDDSLAGWPGLRHWGDHFLVVLRRA